MSNRERETLEIMFWMFMQALSLAVMFFCISKL
jgi:hypothetical protein